MTVNVSGNDIAISIVSSTPCILAAVVIFWLQAVITEERFVPSLNVIANRWRIPDDVAGATLMASGVSAPTLVSSFLALFVTHSALGLGTVRTFLFFFVSPGEHWYHPNFNRY